VVICVTIPHFTEYQSGRCSEIFIRNGWNEWKGRVWTDTQTVWHEDHVVSIM